MSVKRWLYSCAYILYEDVCVLTQGRIAGSDTSGVTLTLTLSLLVNNIDKLKKLVAEIDSAYHSTKDPITFANTQDLPYLNAVINEGMRARPLTTIGTFHSYNVSLLPADDYCAGLARWTTEKTTISGYEIPARVCHVENTYNALLTLLDYRFSRPRQDHERPSNLAGRR